jgi:hypothetical protein
MLMSTFRLEEGFFYKVMPCGVTALQVEKEHQCSGLAFFAALVVVFAVTVGLNYNKVVRSRKDPPTSVSAAQEPHWRLPNMVGERERVLQNPPGRTSVLWPSSAGRLPVLDPGLEGGQLPLVRTVTRGSGAARP